MTRNEILKHRGLYVNGRAVIINQLKQLMKNLDATNGAIQACDRMLDEIENQTPAEERNNVQLSEGREEEKGETPVTSPQGG